MGNSTITIPGLLIGYTMLILPLAILLWHCQYLLKRTLVAVIRMTLQLAFVGFYLQYVFELNQPLINIAWVLVMISVADVSIIRHCRLSFRKIGLAMFVALLVGTFVPVVVFLMGILLKPGLFDARFVIPVGGMILGNCLRADVIGIRSFYQSIKENEKSFLLTLSQGASLYEATGPYLTEAISQALTPTIATMTTIGLVSLPGMMTGVIIGGGDPLPAVKYQIAIMISIFTGTAITVLLGILLTQKRAFTHWGTLKKSIFKQTAGQRG